MSLASNNQVKVKLKRADMINVLWRQFTLVKLCGAHYVHCIFKRIHTLFHINEFHSIRVAVYLDVVTHTVQLKVQKCNLYLLV